MTHLSFRATDISSDIRQTVWDIVESIRRQPENNVRCLAEGILRDKDVIRTGGDKDYECVKNIDHKFQTTLRNPEVQVSLLQL